MKKLLLASVVVAGLFCGAANAAGYAGVPYGSDLKTFSTLGHDLREFNREKGEVGYMIYNTTPEKITGNDWSVFVTFKDGKFVRYTRMLFADSMAGAWTADTVYSYSKDKIEPRFGSFQKVSPADCAKLNKEPTGTAIQYINCDYARNDVEEVVMMHVDQNGAEEVYIQYTDVKGK